MTTPLGLRLDQSRMKVNLAAPFRSLGTFGVWFPRGLLLRVAARDACQRLLEDWQSGGPGSLTPQEQSLLQAAQARVLADPELSPENVANRISELATEHLDAHPREGLRTRRLQVEEQSTQVITQDDPGGWARQTLQRVRDWLGSGVSLPGVATMQQRKSPATKALEAAAAGLAQEWAARLTDIVFSL